MKDLCSTFLSLMYILFRLSVVFTWSFAGFILITWDPICQITQQQIDQILARQNNLFFTYF